MRSRSGRVPLEGARHGLGTERGLYSKQLVHDRCLRHERPPIRTRQGLGSVEEPPQPESIPYLEEASRRVEEVV